MKTAFIKPCFEIVHHQMFELGYIVSYMNDNVFDILAHDQMPMIFTKRELAYNSALSYTSQIKNVYYGNDEIMLRADSFKPSFWKGK